MKEEEPWFKEHHLISIHDFENHTCDLDIWGRFEDTAETHLQSVAEALILQIPTDSFDITYGRDWDNSGESYGEEFHFADGKLRIHRWEADPYMDDDEDEDEDWEDDEDDEDEDSYDITWEETLTYVYTDGTLTLISRE